MLKRFGSSDISNDPFNDSEGAANPMSGVSNMADVMLVLAVGIMMAIMNRSADMNSRLDAVNMEKLTEVESYDTLDKKDLTVQEGLEGLEEKGVVYMDPETGTIYLVVDED